MAALLSKETAIVLPALVACHELLLVRGPWRWSARRIGYGAGLLAVAGGFFLVRTAVIGGLNAGSWDGITFVRTMWMQADVLARYFRLLGWPVGLSVRHHVPVPVSFLEPRTVLSVVAILGVLVLFAAAWRRAPLVAFGIGWFFAALAPVMNVVPLPGAMMGERFCYVPMIGALVALVEGLRRTLPTRGRPRALAAGAGAALMAALAVTTFVRTRDWRDNVTLFEAAARVAPESNAVRINLIREYELRGRPDLARLHWEAAAANTRAYAARYEAIAVRAEAAGERDEAVAWYLRVLRLIPDEPRAVAGLRRLGSGR